VLEKLDQGWMLARNWPAGTGYRERSIAIFDSFDQFDGVSQIDWSQSWNTEMVRIKLTPPIQNPQLAERGRSGFLSCQSILH
jgi:hypothetical protein